MSSFNRNTHKIVLCTLSQFNAMQEAGTLELGVDYRITDVEPATTEDIPTVNDSEVTIQINGVTASSFTTNQANDSTINIQHNAVTINDYTV